VVRVPGIGHVVNDAAIARAILTDGEHFNSHDRGSFGHMITRVLGPRALINMDGPEHVALKRHLTEVFSPRYATDVIERSTTALMAGLRAELRGGRTVDFARFMRHYAGAVACALVGVRVPAGAEQTAYEEIFHLATEIMSLAGLRRRELSRADTARAHAHIDRLAAIVRASYDDDALADLSVARRLRARGLAFEDVRGLVIVVLIGATELIVYGLPRMVAVMIDCGALPALHADGVAAAVDEALRIVTPSNVVLRAVAADCALNGYRFRQGERALVAFRNIMRDGTQFPRPDVFDPTRDIPLAARRLLFGAGPHTCLGVGLALAEARHVVGELVALGGRFTIEERRCNRGKIYPGYTRLLLRTAA
jgi:cytochrome P450